MAAVQDVFYPTSFALSELTAALEDIPHLPMQLGTAGLFSYEGVPTLTIQIERRGTTLELVATSPRGAPGQSIGRHSRDLRPFVIPHLQLDDAVRADEVQGAREFGSATEPSQLQRRIMQVMTLGKRRLDKTLEFHRVGALKGLVLDADANNTVLWDLYAEFGVERIVKPLALDDASTKLLTICAEITETIEDELGGLPFTGIDAWCGRTLYKKLYEHKVVRETYTATPQADALRRAIPDQFEFGGILWRKYRGNLSGSSRMIGDDECYIVPTGVPDLFIGRFGPADYEDTVNTDGLPMYAQGIQMRNRKGWDIEMQSNPIHLCTRPRVIIKGITGASV